MISIGSVFLPLAGIAAAALPLAAQSYTFESFQVSGMPTFARGMNNRGEVVGSWSPERGVRGFRRYSDGRFEAPIIDPEAQYRNTYATGINDSHVVVGFYQSSTGNFQGFLDNGGNFTTFDVQSGNSTQIYGINDLGQFAGTFSDTSTTHGFVNAGGVVTQIDVPGYSATELIAIDHAGALAGGAGTATGVQRAFFRDTGGEYVVFNVSGSDYVSATGISSELGIVAGFYKDRLGQREHGFIYNYRAAGASPDAVTEDVPVTVIDYPGATQTDVFGVNSKGQLSGFATYATGQTLGFIATPAAP